MIYIKNVNRNFTNKVGILFKIKERKGKNYEGNFGIFKKK